MCSGLSFLFMPKNNSKESGMIRSDARGFYSEKSGTIDIFMIGNSNAQAAFTPLLLWNRYGYTSYLAGESGQNILQSLKMLKEILKRQKPKLIILEADVLYYGGYSTVIDSLFNDTIPLLYNHSQWKNIGAAKMLKKPHYTRHCVYKGFYPHNAVKAYSGAEYMIPSDKLDPIPNSIKPVLHTFITVCKNNNLPLLFVKFPSALDWNYPRHNYVSKFAKENGVSFMDLDAERGQYGFDWNTDSRDGGNHLNNSGASKATLFLGKYLSESYSLADHRGDRTYNFWNKDYEKYCNDIKNNTIEPHY